MALRTPEYTTEQLVLLVTLVTMITLMMWFLTDLTGIQRVTSMGFVIVAATVGAIVGFVLFGWPE
jgi:hypothetical protein